MIQTNRFSHSFCGVLNRVVEFIHQAQGELKQIRVEQSLFEDAYTGAVDTELAGGGGETTPIEEDTQAETEADVTGNE